MRAYEGIVSRGFLVGKVREGEVPLTACQFAALRVHVDDVNVEM